MLFRSCSRYRTKSHDKATISNVFPRSSRYQTVLLKLEEIKEQCSALCRAFSFIPPRTEAGKTAGVLPCRAKNSPQGLFSWRPHSSRRDKLLSYMPKALLLQDFLLCCYIVGESGGFPQGNTVRPYGKERFNL